MARKNYSNQFDDLLPVSEAAPEPVKKEEAPKATKAPAKAEAPSEPEPTPEVEPVKPQPKAAAPKQESAPEKAEAPRKGLSLNIPVKMARTSNTRSFYIPDDLYEALVEQGKQRNMSVSVFLTEILDQVFTS